MNSKILLTLTCLILASVLPTCYSLVYKTCPESKKENWSRPTSFSIENLIPNQDASFKISLVALHSLFWGSYTIGVYDKVNGNQLSWDSQWISVNKQAGETYSVEGKFLVYDNKIINQSDHLEIKVVFSYPAPWSIFDCFYFTYDTESDSLKRMLGLI